MKIIKIIFLILMVTMISCSRTLKDFVIEGYEKEKISRYNIEDKIYKDLENNNIIQIEYRAITINEGQNKSATFLSFLSKSSNIIKINILKLNYIYKNTAVNFTNPIEPSFQLTEFNKNINMSYEVGKGYNDFNVGDKVNVVIDIEYEYNSNIYTINANFNIVCVWVEYPAELP